MVKWPKLGGLGTPPNPPVTPPMELIDSDDVRELLTSLDPKTSEKRKKGIVPVIESDLIIFGDAAGIF